MHHDFQGHAEIKMVRYWFNNLFVFILTVGSVFTGSKTVLEAVFYDKRQ